MSDLPHDCGILGEFVSDPRRPLNYSPHHREYWMPVATPRGGASVQQGIFFCPWCGTRLPTPLDEQ